MTGREISAIPREARPYQGHAAGVVTRVVANTIDAAIVAVMVGSIYLGLVVFTFLLDPRTFVWPSGHLLASLTTALVLAVLYLFVSWWLFGRSYGDQVMGLRVVGRRGRRLGPLRSLLRAALLRGLPDRLVLVRHQPGAALGAGPRALDPGRLRLDAAPDREPGHHPRRPRGCGRATRAG